MALPIAPTPMLNRKESKRFMRLIEEGLKVPAYPVPTPKLEQAREMILERMRNGMAKLKPCPFCGGEVVHESFKHSEIIYCSWCDVEMEYSGSSSVLFEKWNKRDLSEKEA